MIHSVQNCTKIKRKFTICIKRIELNFDYLLIGYRIPTWAQNETLYKQLEEITRIHFRYETATPQLARLKGFLLKEMVGHMDEKIKNKYYYDMVMYSGHENTIYNLLNGMKLSDVSNFRIFMNCVYLLIDFNF